VNPALKSFYDRLPVGVQDRLLSLFSAHLGRHRYGGRFAEYQALLRESQWWDAARIKDWQAAQLRKLLVHAYESVPYYQSLFRHHGFDPQRFESVEQLAALPVLTRDTVRTRAEDLLSRRFDRRKLHEGHTSGTTGTPLTVYYDADMVAMNYAVMDRQYEWIGACLSAADSRIAVLRGNVIVPLSQKRPPYWRNNRHLNQRLFSSFHLSPQTAEEYCAALREFRPDIVDGYPSSLYVLARLLLKRGETLPVQAAITSSETLYEFQREAIEAAFRCRVFDYYAAAERVVFSVECDHHRGHHVCEEYGVTEVLGEDGRAVPAGTEGIMAGTSLHNFGMPLIRYQTTDRAAFKTEACTCGRALRLMEDITTKAEDLLRLRDGRLIPPSVLTHPFKPLDSIEGSQLVQTDLDRLLVRIQPGGEFGDHHRSHLVRELKARLGDDMRIDIELVDELPRTARGKFKWVVSQVDTGL
jgi:phenylacetate-CoA ligase